MQRKRIIAGRFELGSVVGSGAMGVVHRGVDVRTGHPVAVKLLTSAGREHLPRFEREASILSELTHAHIVKYVEHGTTEEGEPYLVMEWLEGEDLSQRLKREGIAIAEAIELVRRTGEGLAPAHARGIVHRDLKPSNLFLVGGRIDAIKLLDFGVALLGGGSEPLTRTGVVVGSPGYMAPEQIRGRRAVDVRADVFALGCVLFRCLTGQKPFPGDDAMGVLMRTLLDEAPRVRSLRPEVSMALDQLVDEMLSKAPEKRPQDAAAVVARIDALGNVDDAGRPAPSPRADHGTRQHGNLRSAPTSFLGRERDLQRLHEQLAEGCWLVTLHGPGGTGKTRLAMRYGELHLEERGVWFCNLTDARDLGGVCSAVARALDVSLDGEHTSAEVVARLGRKLGSRGRALVIVDNCEQAVEHAASVLAAWSEAAPRVQFLATSREVLRVRGEGVHELGPLALPGEGEDVASAEAVRLFVDRARLVRRDYVLGEAETPVVAEIARQLDGMPLAIELAAARMGALGERTILERLQSRFTLLAGGARDTAARQRTLHDTIDWSWQLLEPWERSALAQCSVFRGGFTLAAAEAVLDLSGFAGAPPVLDVVQALHDKSLLRSEQSAEGSRRFGMYESIRAFAAEKLEAPDLPLALGRHASHYLSEADEHLVGVYERVDRDCVRRLTLELENLLAVHRRAMEDATPAPRRDALRAMLALDPVLRERGPHDVHLGLLDETLQRPAPGDVALLGRATLSRVRRRFMQCLDAEARADAERALEIGRAEGDAWLEGYALAELGQMAAWRGSESDAYERFAAARKSFAKGGHKWHEASALGQMASLIASAGRSDDARALCEEALATFRELGDEGAVALALSKMAHLLHDVGRTEEARAAFGKMVPLVERIPQMRRRAYALGCMATFHHACGELDQAEQWYERALGIFHTVGDKRYAWFFSAAQGALLASQDKVTLAQEALDRASSLLGVAVLGDVVRLHAGHLDLARARAAAAAGDAPAAARHREQALARLREAGADTTDDLRFATRLLRRALEAQEAPFATLVVAADGRWFQARGMPKMHMGRRPQLWRLLRVLVGHRVDAPGEPLTVDAIFKAAWPGERVAVSRSGAMRVYVQLSRLRSLGLRGALRNVGDGYMLDPSVIVAESD